MARIPRPCSSPLCKNISTTSYCSSCTPVRQPRIRQEHHKLYRTQQWKRMRTIALRDNPLCMACQLAGGPGPMTAHHVDHIIPHRGDRDLFFDKDNLQPLCVSHHSFKTNKEMSGKIYNYKQNIITDEQGNYISKVCQPE